VSFGIGSHRFSLDFDGLLHAAKTLSTFIPYQSLILVTAARTNFLFGSNSAGMIILELLEN
jgi:hypothetical protein